MAESSNTDHTEETNMDQNVAPGGSMMVVTVKTPNGKERITISEDSSVAQVRQLASFQHAAAETKLRLQSVPSQTLRG